MALGAEVIVRRADGADPSQVADVRPTHLVLSPGPLRPKDHPANVGLLERFAGKLPMLGVCLGMQAINLFYGGTIRCDTPPVHGKTSVVYHEDDPLFAGVRNPIRAARYHSLVVDALGDGLDAIAWTEKKQQIMAVRHADLPLWGVQFHPESFMTDDGSVLLRNFLQS